ncbi:YkyB family protein [Mangrovibacillus cuniculi]|uniref:YkyB-like protein n=1 Tax=Mangrovibacillus cuniculi TaxID=2593652 RepID=A0A7S8CAA5_9BACI|nr:YkyB family protein [Mangrovibacillus cuniculi]QPC46166.1 hypothetical protein G8O30_03925 [Mangrovibacillus cuniculi]
MRRHTNTPLQPTINNLSQAIFTVNRHAKTATNPTYLYSLKKVALERLISEGKAKKIGLHFSKNPKLAKQRSDVLVECGEYLFHIPPKKEDFQNLPHLGKLDQSFRNPKTRLSLTDAKYLLSTYTGHKENKNRFSNNHNTTYTKPVFKKLGESFR